MNTIAKRKTKLRFETSETVQGRALIVEAGPWYATIRQKGFHRGYEVSWSSIFLLAAKIEADRKREERKARRKQ